MFTYRQVHHRAFRIVVYTNQSNKTSCRKVQSLARYDSISLVPSPTNSTTPKASEHGVGGKTADLLLTTLSVSGCGIKSPDAEPAEAVSTSVVTG
jgi:hypothetical protein